MSKDLPCNTITKYNIKTEPNSVYWIRTREYRKADQWYKNETPVSEKYFWDWVGTNTPASYVIHDEDKSTYVWIA